MVNIHINDINSQTLELLLSLVYPKVYFRLKVIKLWNLSGFYWASCIVINLLWRKKKWCAVFRFGKYGCLLNLSYFVEFYLQKVVLCLWFQYTFYHLFALDFQSTNSICVQYSENIYIYINQCSTNVIKQKQSLKKNYFSKHWAMH